MSVLPQPEAQIATIEPYAARSAGLESEQRRASLRRKLRHAATLAVEAIVLIGLMLVFFLRVPQVDGHSMAPQIDAGDHVLIDTVAYDLRIGPASGADQPLLHAHLRAIQRGDVVAFVHGTAEGNRVYLKRVVGLPRDTVEIRGGTVFVNGSSIADWAGAHGGSGDMAAVTVAPDSLFVLGDNRGDSDDSRSFGTVPATAVVGRAVCIVWPLARARPIH